MIRNVFSFYKYQFIKHKQRLEYMFIGLKSKALGRVRETAFQQDVTGLHISWSNDQGWPLASSVVGLGAVGGTGPLSSGTTSSPWSLWSSAKSILESRVWLTIPK